MTLVSGWDSNPQHFESQMNEPLNYDTSTNILNIYDFHLVNI